MKSGWIKHFRQENGFCKLSLQDVDTRVFVHAMAVNKSPMKLA